MELECPKNVSIMKELSWLSLTSVFTRSSRQAVTLLLSDAFLGIYSNNLDEFYKVRFADVKRRILIEERVRQAVLNLLKRIQSRVARQEQEFDILYNDLLLEMARNQIFLINERQNFACQQIWYVNISGRTCASLLRQY